jgi:hypothetical protein
MLLSELMTGIVCCAELIIRWLRAMLDEFKRLQLVLHELSSWHDKLGRPHCEICG